MFHLWMHVSRGCWEKWSRVVHSSNEQMSGGRWGSEVTLFSLSPLRLLSFHLSASPFSIYVHTSVCLCARARVCLCVFVVGPQQIYVID